MTFEYDERTDVLWIGVAEPSSATVWIDSETLGVLLRVEAATGRLTGAEVSAWKRWLASGGVIIPELTDQDFAANWLEQARLQTHT